MSPLRKKRDNRRTLFSQSRTKCAVELVVASMHISKRSAFAQFAQFSFFGIYVEGTNAFLSAYSKASAMSGTCMFYEKHAGILFHNEENRRSR